MWDSYQLEAELHVGHVPDDELVTVLMQVLPRGAQLQLNQVEYRTMADETALTLTYRDGAVVRVSPGPALTPEIQAAISSQFHDAFIAVAPPIIGRNIMFATKPIEGHWRREGDFQISPAPPQAPRPEVLDAEHPFVLECRVAASTNQQIVRRRQAKRVRELQLLLNLIARFNVKSPSVLAANHWTLVPDGANNMPSKWLPEGYWCPNFETQAPDWTSLEHTAPIVLTEPGEYYGLWPPAIYAGSLPTCADELFTTFSALDLHEQENFLRAAYWYHTSTEVWLKSQSLSLVSLINAIEVLAGTEAARKQPDAPTQTFLNFMTEYGPGHPSRRKLNKIYDVRGQVSHGARLLGYDADVPGPGLSQRSSADREAGDDAKRLSRGALLNWLWARGKPSRPQLLKIGLFSRKPAKPGTKSSVAIITP